MFSTTPPKIAVSGEEVNLTPKHTENVLNIDV